MGGSIYYRSGWLADFFQAEVEGFTSQPIVAPESKGGTRLLQPVQDVSVAEQIRAALEPHDRPAPASIVRPPIERVPRSASPAVADRPEGAAAPDAHRRADRPSRATPARNL